MRTATAEHRCDESRGLKIRDEKDVRCWQHMTKAERRLAARLNRQAAARGIASDGDWPGNLAYEYLDARHRIITWAAGLGLKLADQHLGEGCLPWLASGQCQDIASGGWTTRPRGTTAGIRGGCWSRTPTG